MADLACAIEDLTMLLEERLPERHVPPPGYTRKWGDPNIHRLALHDCLRSYIAAIRILREAQTEFLLTTECY